MKKELTSKEERFIEELFVPGRSVKEAHDRAGYAEGTSPYNTMRRLQTEIVQRAEFELAKNTPKTVEKLVGLLDNPDAKAADVTLKTANAILDRVGLSRKEKLDVSVETPNGLVFLPPKKGLDEEQDN